MIFAVLSNPELYLDLSQQSETFSYGLLEKGSSNVVDLIKKQYEVKNERYVKGMCRGGEGKVN